MSDDSGGTREVDESITTTCHALGARMIQEGDDDE